VDEVEFLSERDIAPGLHVVGRHRMQLNYLAGSFLAALRKNV
jgi:hypothetical protein